MKIENIPSFDKDKVNVILETPKGSQNKFAYDPEYKVFTLKKTLPMGTVFPFDFGCIPGTKGEDGDPLDILIIMEQPAYPGCLICSRVLGVLTAEQTEKGGKKERNDRFVAVSDCSVLYKSLDNIKDLNKSMIQEIEHFFIDYNKHEGKEFRPIKWQGAKKAIEMIKKASAKAR